MIEVKNLTKQYGHQIGIQNLNFMASKGEILGLLGPNGSGKSTTMNIISGYKPPTSGAIHIDGIEMANNPLAAKRKIGYLPEQPPLYPDLTVISYLQFVAELKGVARQKRQSHLEEIMELVKITDVRGRLIKNLSKGYKQRVGLAQALISNPDILILDEPTVGLDPKQIAEIRTLVKELGKEHTIIFSSHILAEVSMICDRVIIINRGEIVVIDTPQNLTRNLIAMERFLARIKGPQDEVFKLIRSIQGVGKIEMGQSVTHARACLTSKSAGVFDYVIEYQKSRDIKEPLFFAMANHGYVIYELRPLEISLEDAFLQMTAMESENGGANDHAGNF